MNEIKIAGGIVTGNYYPAALQICNLITKYSPITKCEVIATSGSINNINLLSSNKVDFAFVQSDIARDAVKGQGVFINQKPYQELRHVVNLFPEIFTMIVKDRLGAVNFSDLSGKSIGLNLKGSGAKSGLMTLFKYYKFEKDPQIVHIVDSQIQSKLCDDEIDSVVLFTGHPSSAVNNIASSCDVEFISIDPLKLDSLLIDSSIYEKSILRSKSYTNISRNASTFATKSILVTNQDENPEKVNLLIKILKRYFDEFKTSYPVLNNLNKDDVFGPGIIDSF
jgi:TRAP transporter TAXI family solute receptor